MTSGRIRQDVDSSPAAYMGWFYKIDEDCNLTSLGLAFNGTTGKIFGRTKLYDQDDPLLSVDCEVGTVHGKGTFMGTFQMSF